ncbi:hypothetical protein CAPTEDRAFT_205225, partial [Capitella teleta]
FAQNIIEGKPLKVLNIMAARKEIVTMLLDYTDITMLDEYCTYCCCMEDDGEDRLGPSEPLSSLPHRLGPSELPSLLLDRLGPICPVFNIFAQMVCKENGSPRAGDPLRSSAKPQNARPKDNQSYVPNENQRYTLPPLEKCGPHIYINGKKKKIK